MKNFIKYFILTVIINTSLFSQELFAPEGNFTPAGSITNEGNFIPSNQTHSQGKLTPAGQSFPDPYENVFQAAEKLRLSGAQKEAATEYKRYIFLQDYSQGTHLSQSYKALSTYYKEQENYGLAVSYFKLALNTDTTENLIPNQLELIELMRLDANSKNESLEKNPLFFSYLWLNEPADCVKEQAWKTLLDNMIHNKDWNHLESTFTQSLTLFPTLFTQEQQKEFSENLNSIVTFKPKNQMLAAHLSFIPGLGQLYAKDYADALNAFLLNGSLITLGVYSICTHNYFDFSLLEFDVIWHFYKGNLYNAQKDVYQYNQKQILTYQNKMLEITRQKKENEL